MVAQNTLRTCEERKIYFKDKFEFATKECLRKIKLTISFYMSASISELRFNIITMKNIGLSLNIHSLIQYRMSQNDAPNSLPDLEDASPQKNVESPLNKALNCITSLS